MEVTAVPMTLTPLYQVVVKGPSVTFMRPEGTDAEHFRLTMLGADQAELLFLPSAELLEELKEAGIAVPKADPASQDPLAGRGRYLVAVAPFFVTSFWTRQLISSPTQISFSDGHAIAWIHPNSPRLRPGCP